MGNDRLRNIPSVLIHGMTGAIVDSRG